MEILFYCKTILISGLLGLALTISLFAILAMFIVILPIAWMGLTHLAISSQSVIRVFPRHLSFHSKDGRHDRKIVHGILSHS